MRGIRKTLSEILVSIAFILLVVYILDVGVSMINEEGFLPLSERDRGMIFGGGSIILFVVSFGIGINVPSKLLTVLLIIGGAIMGTTVLVSSLFMPSEENAQMSSTEANQMQILAPQFIGIIIIGYVIMGMGILRAIRKK
ncbi:hypothetical protein [Candidatus Nitrosocosmicus franklandus]|uniref:Uncharacterized protein n=1 Tax=Candidatus Nitrosocosmicus franklandianus TaxID=1798806 RepID=A0A484I5L2_9ARCH|nr:hypothetical protein [Candidatus Nitrosocosmicus franklandus]VFJ13019.1 conserved membrane protein of unknown function [Candidatus Nitrosocosmicus franklandus]